MKERVMTITKDYDNHNAYLMARPDLIKRMFGELVSEKVIEAADDRVYITLISEEVEGK